tara:strand:+ start:43 stop:552 length:510 start_codon:yes stop_codon:yes gene_type:complete
MDNITASQQANRRTKQLELDARVRNVAVKIQDRFGYSAPVLSGILGNINVETGNTFDYKQKQNKGPAEGLFQFDFHKPNYKKYLKRKGLKDSVDSQVGYVHDSIYGDEQKHLGQGNAKKLRKLFAESADPIEISDGFQDIFLRPKKEKAHTDRRREASRMYSLAFTPAQ